MGKKLDLTGRRFGRLTALFPTDRRGKKGSVYWHCRCDCGKEVEVSENGLVHGNYRSCGCLKREIQRSVPSRLHMVDGTCVEWLEKRKHRSDNTSGFRGVSLNDRGTWRASIGFQGKRYHLGTYATFEKAVAARLEAEDQLHAAFVRAYYRWQEKYGALAPQDRPPLHVEVSRRQNGFRVFSDP